MAVSADVMSAAQAARAAELYHVAAVALRALDEERLNLSFGSRDALNVAQGALESFDYFRLQQPVKGGRP
jgi:hypothetical protein